MKHKSDPDIGFRAAQCVRLYAHKHGLTLEATLFQLGYDRKTIYSWENDSAPAPTPCKRWPTLVSMSTTSSPVTNVCQISSHSPQRSLPMYYPEPPLEPPEFPPMSLICCICHDPASEAFDLARGPVCRSCLEDLVSDHRTTMDTLSNLLCVDILEPEGG